MQPLAVAPVPGCQADAYLDRTAPAADRELEWTLSIASSAERCMQVRIGQSVRWVGNFGVHPLDPEGGDQPNAVATHADGLVTFGSVGTFGYVCGVHPSMKGAIRVVAAPAAPVPAVVPIGLVTLLGALTLVTIALRGRFSWLRRRRP